jgi:CubicO group peptidase (beta-lactamase class C family)
VDEGTVPLAVVMSADAHGAIHEAAAGPATPDSLFRIASMTKIVTTLGALKLDLDLDAPVAHYVPEFAQLQVLEGFDDDGTPRLRPPRTHATVGQLFTHTSGLGYYFLNERLLHWRRLHGTGRDQLYREPLVSDPGTRFEYGISTDWLGRVVEAASGQLLDAYLDEHVLGPLGMCDTTFRPTAEQRARLVPVHVRKDGAWQPTDADWPQDPGWAPGGHGLYSTPRDFLRLQRHLLSQDDDLFTPRVEFPAHIATAHPRTSADLRLGPGLHWGLGGVLAGPGRGGWMGLYNTHFWVDRRAGRTNALYTQTQPFAEPAVLGLARRVVYA